MSKKRRTKDEELALSAAWDEAACDALAERLRFLGVHLPPKALSGPTPKVHVGFGITSTAQLDHQEQLIRRIDARDYRYLRLLVRMQKPAIVMHVLEQHPLEALDTAFRLGGYDALYEMVDACATRYRKEHEA